MTDANVGNMKGDVLMLRKCLALCLVVLLWMTGCTKQESAATVTLSDVTPTGLTYTLTASEDLQTGRSYSLEKQTNGAWQAVPTLNDAFFTTEAYLLSSDHPYSETIHWEWLYGTLEEGHYRLVKTVHRIRPPDGYDTISVYGEFDIA